MGIGESLFYESEFSPKADAALRDVLGARYDAKLAAELSSIRYAVQFMHTGRPPKALAAPERRKLRALRLKYEQLWSVLRSLSKTPRTTTAAAADQTLDASTKAAVSFAVHGILSKHGRFGEFSRRAKPPARPGKLTVLDVRETPDFFATLANEVTVFIESLRVLETSPLPGGRPTFEARDHAAISVVDTLKRWNIPLSKTRNGVLARVLEVVLLEFGLEAPEDFARLVRLSVDRANDPDWVKNLVRSKQVSPLLDD